MALGMFLGQFAPPRPMKPSFVRTIPTTVSPHDGTVLVHFYTPRNYKSVRSTGKPGTKFPVVVNFHGGGFTLGSATDDARWASCVVEQTDAVVASVAYRLAPEFPFPTAVEDGVDAVLYLARYADDLWLDPQRISISGFSCGGNLAFTVPLRLKEELDPAPDTEAKRNLDSVSNGLAEQEEEEEEEADYNKKTLNPRNQLTRLKSGIREGGITYSQEGLPELGSESSNPSTSQAQPARSGSMHPTKSGSQIITSQHEVSESLSSLSSSSDSRIHLRIPAIIAWYPSTDYTLTREQRRETLLRKDMELSTTFTSLFDASYLYSPPPPHVAPLSSGLATNGNDNDAQSSQEIAFNRSNPFLSPGVAPEALLAGALPDNIMIFTCEWDMLRAEGEAMEKRLEGLGKNVLHRQVKGVPHGWDKSPNPFREAKMARMHYGEACSQLRRIHGIQ